MRLEPLNVPNMSRYGAWTLVVPLVAAKGGFLGLLFLPSTLQLRNSAVQPLPTALTLKDLYIHSFSQT